MSYFNQGIICALYSKMIQMSQMISHLFVILNFFHCIFQIFCRSKDRSNQAGVLEFRSIYANCISLKLMLPRATSSRVNSFISEGRKGERRVVNLSKCCKTINFSVSQKVKKKKGQQQKLKCQTPPTQTNTFQHINMYAMYFVGLVVALLF